MILLWLCYRNRPIIPYNSQKVKVRTGETDDTGGAGESRTHTSLRTVDFESTASAIPPLRQQF